MSKPKISALFSTFNRAELLREALAALQHQTLSKEDFEVVVIDDGSSDSTREVALSFQSILPLRYEYQPNQGLAEGKNHGVKLANAPIVVFMDDDDVPAPNLLEQHLKTHNRYPNVNTAVLGYTDLRPDLSKLPLMHFVTQVGYYLFSYPKISHGEELDYTYFWGGRSSCKKQILYERGMFDPVFEFGCEDIELGYRLKESGPFRVIYNAKAKSTMIRAVSLEDFLKRVYRQGQSNYLFWQKHPVEEICVWADVKEIEARWKSIEDRVELIKASAKNLDEIANVRLREGIELDQFSLALLHRSYWYAIDTMKLFGSYQKMIELDAQLSEKTQLMDKLVFLPAVSD